MRYFLIVTLAWLLVDQADAQENPETFPGIPLEDIHIGEFEDEELDLPYYLFHFHRLADAVEMEGEHKGFINLPVWRNEKDNKPYNARIMENIYSLAYFYATDKPWNLYYKQEQVKERIETALAFWCSIQNEDGRFSEYSEGGWNLPGTAFATKFMGEAIGLLQGTGGIDPDLMEKVLKAQRKAIMITLTDEELYQHGKSFSNQFSNVWSGALAYLSNHDDPEMAGWLRKRIEQSMDDFQSPAGYFYERDGPDWAYNLGTHENNLMMAWSYVQGTELEPYFKKKYEDFLSWLAYNAVPEPGNQLFYLNGGISTRRVRSTLLPEGRFFTQSIPVSSISPLANAFLLSEEAWQKEADSVRLIMEEAPEILPLITGEFNAYTPYGLLHRNLEIKLPAEAERLKAIEVLPCNSRNDFIQQRVDSRKHIAYTFVKQPGYYGIFNSGEILHPSQAYGLGLLWLPGAGAFIQPQVQSKGAVWGTASAEPASAETVSVEQGKTCESADFYPEFRISGEPVDPSPGVTDFPGGDLEISYDLDDTGEKQVHFRQDRILVHVRKPGEITELIPFLSDCHIEIIENEATIRKNGKTIRLLPAGEVAISSSAPEHQGETGIRSLELKAQDELRYELVINH